MSLQGVSWSQGVQGQGLSSEWGREVEREARLVLPPAFRLTPYSLRARDILPVGWKRTQGQQWMELVTQDATYPRFKLVILE